MGIKADLLHVPMTEASFNFSRNYQLIPDTALIEPSTNYNLHNLGLEQRGGSSKVRAFSVTNRVMGGYDFRQSNGHQYMVYAKNNGSVYRDNDTNVLATGMSTSNFFHFGQYYDDLYISDGASTPKKWDGTTVTTLTPASDWALNPPFQMIFHPRGASFRMWAVCSNGVYASSPAAIDDFSDGGVILIPIYSKGGLVGAIEFGQELFVFSRTECFRILDTDADPTNWGYEKAIWTGGVAHWRLIVLADNNVFMLTDDLNIYSLQGVFQTGDYRQASISRPAQIDRYLREQTSYSNIENWHAAYDPKLRCIKWFIQVSGTTNNQALVQFLDKPADKCWAVHNNQDYASGYSASCSFTNRTSVSDWRIRTGDYTGSIWELESPNKYDNLNPYTSILKFKKWEFGNPVMHKHFPKGLIRTRSSTPINFDIYMTVNSYALPTQHLSLNSQSAVFDTAIFDTDTFAAENIGTTPFDIKAYGETLQMEIRHSSITEDFFISEIIIAFKECGERIYA
jgi:hypothetical protein